MYRSTDEFSTFLNEVTPTETPNEPELVAPTLDRSLNADSLIKTLPNDICCHILTFVDCKQITALLSISKTWRNTLLCEHVFTSLWRRICIGADPIRPSFGHTMELAYVFAAVCLWCVPLSY